ncbi:SCO4226 family nickel-binding protein [Streptomyces sp. 15-116A]|uniref:SCO4226 family nickel-binding protein n=1 Tax=Streptomyces sp. 15-116A TaxID=2259035 RepID=UPI0021B29F9F|nr:SCO4226 family nickel-binding protein [Streptomyces sp. 15-116A]MCT7351694.1 SCO4226 family nickel-binding protein [Streptomyces sp. 15-116A]
MTQFMDVHHGAQGITEDQLREAMKAEAELEEEMGVRFQHVWADPESGTVYCLTDGPSADAVQRVHERTSGRLPDEIHPVPLSL